MGNAETKRFRPLSLETLPLSGAALIEASAGTGKTYTIANLYLRLIMERGLTVREILVVTFTDAATRELRDRIRSNLTQTLDGLRGTDAAEDEQLKRRLMVAASGFDEAAIFTIHGFCQRMLRDHAFESRLPFDTELVTDQTPLIQEVVDDFWRQQVSGGDSMDVAVLQHGGVSLGSLEDLGRVCLQNPGARRIPEPGPGSRDRLMQSLKTAADEWARSRDQVTDILLNDACLKRSADTFRKDLIPGLVETLDLFFNGEPDPAGFSAISRTSQTFIDNNLKGKKVAPEHPFFDACDRVSSSIAAYLLEIRHAFINYLFEELESRKTAADQMSFDDLLSRMAGALEGEGGDRLAASIRSRFRAALIDEFQDTDPIQYKIFKRIFAPESGTPDSSPAFFQIGDPKQAIYGFRGADIFAYIQAAEAAEAEATFTLSTNWRSETGVMAAVNHLFDNMSAPFGLDGRIGFIPVDAAGESKGNRARLTVDGESPAALVIDYLAEPPGREGKGLTKEMARDLALRRTVSEIGTLLTGGRNGQIRLGERPLKASDMAVLVTRNADAVAVKDALSACRIPAVISKSGSVFETPEADALMAVMAAVAQPGNTLQRHAAMVSMIMGMTAGNLAAFLETDDGQAEYEDHMARFSGYHQTWASNGFYAMFRQVLTDYQVRERLLCRPAGERELTNLLHLAEQLHEAETLQHAGMHRLIAWFQDEVTRAGENPEAELRLESDADAVQILTVFKSKGLEYPIVFCPFMWQQQAGGGGGVVYHNDDDEAVIDLSPDNQAGKAAEAERLSELLRLLYVALTRPRNRCYLTVGLIGKKHGFQLSALDYLFAGGMPGQSRDLIRYFREFFKDMGDDNWQETIRTVVSTAPEESMRFRQVEAPDPYIPISPDGTPGLSLRERMFTRAGGVPRSWGVTSYSRLVAGDPEEMSHPLHPVSSSTEKEAPPDPFFGFPKGAIPGTCMHSIFETADFQSFPDSAGDRVVRDQLIRYGIGTEARRDALVQTVSGKVAAVLSAPLMPSDPGMVLKAIPPSDRLAEMGFFYPVAHLTPDRLKTVFLENGLPVCPAYPDRIGRLTFSALEGFMQGFIDLMFCWKKRYYLLDWKTNHLGDDPAAYEPDHLVPDMAASHYLLQYHIYTVAAHRYLASRIPDYDYDTHFGGVFYLFIRGVGIGDSPANGIFFDRPSKDLIRALSALGNEAPEGGLS